MHKVLAWILGSVVAAAILLVGGSWFAGRMAHARVTQFIEHVPEQFNGVLRVVERNSIGGLFSSVEDITFAIDSPIATVLPAKLTASKPSLQFTLHNVIAHGPLPGLRTVGVARVETSLLLDDAQRKQLVEILGTDKPLAFVVTLGLLGDTQVDIASPAMTVRSPGDGSVMNWKGMQSHIDYSKDFGDFKSAALLPGISVKSKNGSSVSFDDVQMDTDFRRKFENLYVGDGSFKIADITVTQPSNSKGTMRIKNAAYAVHLSADQDFLNLGAKTGASLFASDSSLLKNLRFDFTVNHLHGAATAALYKRLQNRGAGTAAQTQPTDQMRADLITVLRHSPELVIENAGFTTDDGDLKIVLHAKFDEVKEQDFRSNADLAQLIKKLTVEADIRVAQAVVDHWPAAMNADQAKQQVAQLIQQGYLVRNIDRLEAHLEFHKGVMTANGKPVGPRAKPN